MMESTRALARIESLTSKAFLIYYRNERVQAKTATSRIGFRRLASTQRIYVKNRIGKLSKVIPLEIKMPGVGRNQQGPTRDVDRCRRRYW